MEQVYPWQSALQARWMQPGEPRHHALLFYGKAGIGKLAFARAMAATLLCMQPSEGVACGRCEACHWLQEGSHPDYREVAFEDSDVAEDTKRKTRKRQQISIDQIRQLHDYLSLSNHQVDGVRVVLIQPLEAMNTAAANALLKLLEEPPPRTQFLLVSHQLQALLPTILSRCFQVEMPSPAREQGMAWLAGQGVAQPAWYWQYTAGAPIGMVAELSEVDWHGWYQQWRTHLLQGAALDITAAGTLLMKQGMAQAIQALQKWLVDVWLSCYQLPLRYHHGEESGLARLAATVQLSQLLAFQQQLNRF
ncbi:MAG TPA: DNA polymerase III subunit delta', partial [Methylophilus sp.]